MQSQDAVSKERKTKYGYQESEDHEASKRDAKSKLSMKSWRSFHQSSRGSGSKVSSTVRACTRARATQAKVAFPEEEVSVMLQKSSLDASRQIL